jgi:AcrR family transcriptional regulator
VSLPEPVVVQARRHITPRQAVAVDRLLEAAAHEARASGYDGMSVRAAARRAGVAPATAYTLFASKDHLLAEVMRREMSVLLQAPRSTAPTTRERVEEEMRLLGTFMAEDPELASAGTTALLGPGPEVAEVRVAIGTAFHDRIAGALQPQADQRTMRTLDLVYTGALLWMGMGHLDPDQVPDTLAAAAALVIGADR